MSYEAIEKSIIEAKNAYLAKQLTKEEYQYIINEIKDVQAANKLAGDEVAIRRIVDICKVALSII